MTAFYTKSNNSLGYRNSTKLSKKKPPFIKALVSKTTNAAI